MANLNGQTVEELAAEIVNAAIEPAIIEIDGTFSQKLDKLAQYNNRDVIQMRGESYWTKNRDMFRKDALHKLIEGSHKQLVDRMEKKATAAKDEYFRMLRSRGVSPVEADKMAYGTGN